MIESLFKVIKNGDIISVKEKISKTDVNVFDEHGKTPLHYAVKHDFKYIVKLLLEHGADPMQGDLVENKPPFLDAKSEVMRVLLKRNYANSSHDDKKNNDSTDTLESIFCCPF